MIDELLVLLKAIKGDFRELLLDKRIPLETRMEWFVNYGEEFLGVEINDGADHLTVEMSGYLEEGFTDEDLPRITKLLTDGVHTVVN